LVIIALSSPVSQRRPVSLTEAAAMQMLYADYDSTRKSYLWSNPEIPDGLCNFEFYSGQAFIVTPVNMWPVQENGFSKVYLVTTAQPNDRSWGSHPDAPLIGVAVFKQEDGNWHIEWQNRALGCFGSLGNAAPVSLVRWAENSHAVRIDPAFTN